MTYRLICRLLTILAGDVLGLVALTIFLFGVQL